MGRKRTIKQERATDHGLLAIYERLVYGPRCADLPQCCCSHAGGSSACSEREIELTSDVRSTAAPVHQPALPVRQRPFIPVTSVTRLARLLHTGAWKLTNSQALQCSVLVLRGISSQCAILPTLSSSLSVDFWTIDRCDKI